MPIYRADVAGTGYVQSRGAQLITNGTGSLLSNANFPGWDFDGTQAPAVGVFGSFSATSLAVGLTTDEYIAVDPGRYYRLAFYVRGNGMGQTMHAGYGCYDADFQEISPANAYHVAGTETTLAADLVAGATTVTLTDATAWVVTGDTAVIGWWPYTSAQGYAHADYTYTRNIYRYGASNQAGVSKTGNAITFGTGYTYSGDTVPAGTAVAQMASALTFQYNIGSSLSAPTAWTQWSGFIYGMGVPANGATDAANTTLLRPGTAAIRPYWRPNANSVTGSQTWIAGISLDGDYRDTWRPPTYLNGWANISGTSYRWEYGGTVRLRGQISGGTIATGSTGNAFVLPAGFRPARDATYLVATGSAAGSTTLGRIDVLTTGDVRITAGSNTRVPLDGVAFSTT